MIIGRHSSFSHIFFRLMVDQDLDAINFDSVPFLDLPESVVWFVVSKIPCQSISRAIWNEPDRQSLLVSSPQHSVDDLVERPIASNRSQDRVLVDIEVLGMVKHV